MNWEMIGSIFTVITFLFTVYIEWPRFQERLAQSTHSISRGLMLLIPIGLFVGLVIFVIVLFPGANDHFTLGRISILLIASSGSGFAILIFRRAIKEKNVTIILISTFSGLLGFIITIGLLYMLITG